MHLALLPLVWVIVATGSMAVQPEEPKSFWCLANDMAYVLTLKGLYINDAKGSGVVAGGITTLMAEWLLVAPL